MRYSFDDDGTRRCNLALRVSKYPRGDISKRSECSSIHTEASVCRYYKSKLENDNEDAMIIIVFFIVAARTAHNERIRNAV